MKQHVLYALFNIMAAVAWFALLYLLAWSGLLSHVHGLLYYFYGSLLLVFFAASFVAIRLYYRLSRQKTVGFAVVSAFSWLFLVWWAVLVISSI